MDRRDSNRTAVGGQYGQRPRHWGAVKRSTLPLLVLLLAAAAALLWLWGADRDPPPGVGDRGTGAASAADATAAEAPPTIVATHAQRQVVEFRVKVREDWIDPLEYVFKRCRN